MKGHRDLELTARAAIGLALLALLLPIEWLSLLLAAPLALFLPGYAIASMACARRPLELPQLLTLSLGLSLATLAVGGLVLNYLPGGLRAGPWTLVLVLVVLATAREAALRRPRPRATTPGGWRRPPVSAAGLSAAAAGLVAAAAAIALAFTTVEAENAIGYTELWMQPLQAPRAAAVRIGVGSNEQDRVRYRLEARFGKDDTRSIPPFSLEPGETRIVRLGVPRDRSGPPLRVIASLFRSDRPERPYRRASAWTPPKPRPR